MGAIISHAVAGQGTTEWQIEPIAAEGAYRVVEVPVEDALRPWMLEMPTALPLGVKPAQCEGIVTLIFLNTAHAIASVENSFSQAWN